MAIGTENKTIGDGNSGTFSGMFWTPVIGTGPYQPYPKIMDAMFSVAGTQLTMPTVTSTYAANNSVSNSATIGSVTAQTATVSAINDQPVILDWIKVDCDDATTTAWQGKSIAVHIFQTDPTANSGVQAGDRSAWSNKRAGYLGRFEGTFRTLSDGAVARLTPSEGGPFILFPTSGAATIFFQYQALSDTGARSGSTTHFNATFFGRQGQA